MKNNLKEKEMMFTSHNLATLKIKKKLEAIPAEKQTDAQRRFLAQASIGEKHGGMITIHDVQMEKREQAKRDADALALAELKKLQTEQAAKDASKKTAGKKPAAPKVTTDGKKKK